MRPEAKFSDGTPVTAQDVLFSYEQLRDKGLSSFRTVFAQMVAGAEVLDDRSIRFTFTPDYPRRDLIQSAGGLPVFSKADFERSQHDLGESSKTPYVGSGPYMFDGEFDPTNGIVGNRDLIRVAVADIGALERFILEQLTPIPGIEKIRSSFALKQVRYKTALPLRGAA